MRSVTLFFARVFWLLAVGSLIAESNGVGGALLMAGLALFPHAFSHFVAVRMQPVFSGHLCLLIAMLLHALWFFYLYGEVFYWSLDPQGAIIFIFAGFYALPVLIPLWALAWWLSSKRDEI